MANILLGYPDDEISTEGASALDNFIGGSLISPLPPTTHLPSHPPLCPICAEAMPFILQLYCPVDSEGGRPRVLFVFTCLNKECQKDNGRCSWRVFRLQTSASQAQPQHTANVVDSSKFDWKLDDDGEEEFGEDAWFNPPPETEVRYFQLPL